MEDGTGRIDVPRTLIIAAALGLLWTGARADVETGFPSGEFDIIEEPGFLVTHQHCDGTLSTPAVLPLPKPLSRRFAGTEVVLEATLDETGRTSEVTQTDGYEGLFEELAFSIQRTRFAPVSACVRLRYAVTETVVKEADIVRIRPWADISLSPTGTVTEVDFGGDVHPAVAAALERQIDGWAFEPGSRDGQPAKRTTSVLLEAEMVPDGPDRWTLTSRRLMTGPRLVRRTATEWPRRGMGAGAAGQVRVSFVVDKKGRPQDIAIVEADPPQIFDRAARNTVRKWRYKPETVGGKPVSSGPLEVLIDFDPRRAALNAREDPHARSMSTERLMDLERMWDQGQMMRDRQRLRQRAGRP
jgi:TonB family protein